MSRGAQSPQAWQGQFYLVQALPGAPDGWRTIPWLNVGLPTADSALSPLLPAPPFLAYPTLS